MDTNVTATVERDRPYYYIYGVYYFFGVNSLLVFHHFRYQLLKLFNLVFNYVTFT